MAATIHLFLFLLLRYLGLCSSDTYSVKITTEEHVNVVDTRFLSFTVDPKYLFSSSDKYSRYVQSFFNIIMTYLDDGRVFYKLTYFACEFPRRYHLVSLL